MISLVVKAQIAPLSWQEFTTQSPPFSIALDGYVKEGPRFNPTGPWANFNHHEEVSRLETRATCAQVLIAVRSGLYCTFCTELSSPKAHLYVNDCDEDVCLSVFILKNSHLAINTMNPPLNRLVSMEDMLDTTGGAYPFPKDLGTLQELMWVFAPYHTFRTNGGLDKRVDHMFEGIIEDVGNRIMGYINGNPHKIELDTRFKKIGGGSNWTMVREIGPNARIGVYGDKIQAFVSVRERGEGRFTYSIGRSSQFVPFPIPKILKALNEAEKAKKGDLLEETWGGSDIISGSPRINGSILDPKEVTRIIEETLKR